jgi:hypothetical protein
MQDLLEYPSRGQDAHCAAARVKSGAARRGRLHWRGRLHSSLSSWCLVFLCVGLYVTKNVLIIFFSRFARIVVMFCMQRYRSTMPTKVYYIYDASR